MKCESIASTNANDNLYCHCVGYDEDSESRISRVNMHVQRAHTGMPSNPRTTPPNQAISTKQLASYHDFGPCLAASFVFCFAGRGH